MTEYLILVYTSSHAIGIEKQLKKRGIICSLSSIPRGISSDCGLCVRFDEADLEVVKRFIQSLSFEIEGIVKCSGK